MMKEGTDLAQRWFCSRPTPAFIEEMPCGLIYFTDEIAEHENSAPRRYVRTLLLTTEVLHMMEPEREVHIDDWMDSRAFEIEAAFLADRNMGLPELVQDSRLVRTQPTQLSIEGEMDVASIRLFWEIVWAHDNYNTSQLTEFLRFTAEHRTTGGATAVDDVHIREE